MCIAQNRSKGRCLLSSLYPTSTFSIMHFFCPPKFCITFVFHFSWVLQPSQEKLKKVGGAGGQITCIMGRSGLQRTLRWCYTGRFATTILAQHSVTTSLLQCFERLQYCSNIWTLCWAKIVVANRPLYLRSNDAAATRTSPKTWIWVLSVFIAIIPTDLLCQMYANPSEFEFQGTIFKSRKPK